MNIIQIVKPVKIGRKQIHYSTKCSYPSTESEQDSSEKYRSSSSSMKVIASVKKEPKFKQVGTDCKEADTLFELPKISSQEDTFETKSDKESHEYNDIILRSLFKSKAKQSRNFNFGNIKGNTEFNKLKPQLMTDTFSSVYFHKKLRALSPKIDN